MEEISALTMVVKSASMGTPKTKTPNPKTKVNSLKGNGNKGMLTEIAPGEARKASCISCMTLQAWAKANTMLQMWRLGPYIYHVSVLATRLTDNCTTSTLFHN